MELIINTKDWHSSQSCKFNFTCLLKLNSFCAIHPAKLLMLVLYPSMLRMKEMWSNPAAICLLY